LSESVNYLGSNESTAAELSDDRLMLNSRNQKGDVRARLVSISEDGGKQWDTTYFDPSLPDPVCEGSLLNVGWRKGKALLAFCNPASPTKRDSLTLRISSDEGQTWKKQLLIDEAGGPGDHHAYSDLVWMKNNWIGVIYERKQYTEIVFRNMRLGKKRR
jgi:sialidase-1